MLINLATHLDRRQYRPCVGLLKKGWLSDTLQAAGVEVFFFRHRRPYDPVCLGEIIQFVRQNHVALIHTHEFMMNTYGALAGRIIGVPVVATVHGKNYFWERWQRRLAYRMVAKSTYFVAVSRHLQQFIHHRLNIAERHIHVIHNGIAIPPPQDVHQMASLYQTLKLPQGVPIVGMVGSLYPVKGYPVFIEAARQIRHVFPETIFLIAGCGPLLPTLKAQAAACGLGDRIRFLGFREDVPHLLQLMDVFVLSSLDEGFSLVTLEAMAAGKPVVVTRSGGPEEIVEDGVHGDLVPTNDASAIAEKTLLLLQDPSRAQSVGLAGRRHVEAHFTLGHMLAQYQTLYDSAG